MPLSNSYQLETGLKVQGQGIAKFAGLTGHITCVTPHSASEVTPLGHFEHSKVPLWTKNGKKMITADRYLSIHATSLHYLLPFHVISLTVEHVTIIS